MASQASLVLAFNIIFFISLILFMTNFLPQVHSRPLQKTNDLIQRDEGKQTNPFGLNNNNHNKKVKNMKPAVNEMKFLPPFPNIPDFPFAPFPFPPPFNIPPFPNFPLPPFPNLPPFPFPPPAA